MKSPLIILQRINGLYNTLKHENWTLRWNEIIILSVLLYFSIFFHFFFLAISIQFWKNFQNSRHVFETPCSHIPKDQVKHSLENGNTIKARDKCAETICARLQLRERENRIILQLPKELNLISLQLLQISIHPAKHTFRSNASKNVSSLPPNFQFDNQSTSLKEQERKRGEKKRKGRGERERERQIDREETNELPD